MFELSRILKCSLILIWIINCTDGQCTTRTEGSNYLFGPNCDFTCHCINKQEQCNGITGECTSGCDWEWAGQGCQYKNIAIEKTSRHLDNIPENHYSDLANDKDLNTCSETDYENSTRNVNPWWKIWFPQNETFRQLTIRTSTGKENFFRSFNITVELVPENQSKNKNFYPASPQLCYEQRERDVETIFIPVTCEKSLVGNQLRISLGSSKTQLVICDIRIFGCPIGFYGEQCKQPCSANCLNHKCSHVDGTCTDGCNDGWKIPKCQECATGLYGEQCNQQCNANCLNQNCDRVHGTCSDGCQDGWTRPHCNQACVTGRYGAQCNKQCSENCLGENKLCDHVNGRCTNGCQDGWTNPRCDQACSAGRYGARCNEQCSNNCLGGLCDHIDGRCSNGCKDGWTNSRCDKECAAGRYGAQCIEQCSENCLGGNQLCDHVNGRCTKGCNDGWTNPRCDQECAAGRYGAQCNEQCSENCLGGNQLCDHVNGRCTKGCNDGWTNPQCDQVCTAGSFGAQCKQQCSSNCNYGDKYCNHVDGKCNYGCKDGWTNPQCSQECSSGFYGRECRQRCNVTCLNQKCNHVNGNCTDGCKDGWKNPHCDQVCTAGSFGAQCKQQCTSNCNYGDKYCNHVDGKCNYGCKDGWTNPQCSQECPAGSYGANCTQRCSINCLNGNVSCNHVDGRCTNGCKNGWTNPQCNQECSDGKYGAQCKNTCSSYCLHVIGNKDCGHVDGRCNHGCKDGWTNPQCSERCADGTYGANCGRNCSVYCFTEGLCDKSSGKCQGGCKPGYTGDTCDQKCEVGFYGGGCVQRCSEHCLNGREKCDHVNGNCNDGCQNGWTFPKCKNECKNGTYGKDCGFICSGNCLNKEICVKSTGNCPRGCKPGYKGDKCERMCLDGHFGKNCTQKCSEHCIDVCKNVDGTCARCELGWKGVNCTTECNDGSFGENCNNSCGHCKDGLSCHKTNGTCTLGCAEGFTGHGCMEALKLSEAGPVQQIIGGIVVLLVIAATMIGVVLLLRRRRSWKQKDRNSNKVASTEEQSAESQLADKKGFNTYSNAAMVEDSRKVSDEVNAKNVRKGKGNQIEMIQAKQGNLRGNEEDAADVYYNAGPMTKQRSTSAIRISDFGAYFKSGLSSKDSFFDEFQKIPYGSVHSTQIAKKPGNNKKNRYKDMYAYDHSRVILNKLPDDPDSDYINASYIRGNVVEKAYIAAQGPTDFNVNDFWRMVLEKNVHTIVMVTNLVEETKMKCIQYWAEVGATKTYGPINIHTERECVFAEYTVRKFTITQTDKPEMTRKVTHYNYTAWPDKDVPKSTSSLLHFWRRVRQNDEKTRPWLVHCSAGVGRTGTFIAIDVLYDQGKDLGFLDIYQCVRDLRDQRVNMVQTKEQYKYLHSIMTEIFVLPSQPIKMEEFSVVFRDLKEIDRTTGKTKLLLEYETLRDETSNTLQEEESSAGSASTHKAESIYSCAKLSENKKKNRYDNILASNEYRPFLSTDVKGCTNYINAVYISSYCEPHGFILTQTPMKHTVVDLYRLILEQEVKVVVTFDDYTGEEVGICFPEEGSATSGPFKMTFVSESCNQNFKTRTHTLKYQKKEQNVLQVVFNEWQTGIPVPSDPYKMYSFLQDLEKLQKQHEQKPIILSCLNGAERSGLIAVLINIIERARFDGEVSIPQVIRQLRVRRQQIIPNFDQYKFCYDVFLCHAETNTTYANM